MKILLIRFGMDGIISSILADIAGYARNITRGEYDKTSKILQYTKKDCEPEIKNLVEEFGMMSVKLEARELDLENTIDELRKKKAQLELSIKLRDEFSLIFISFIVFISFYGFVVAFITESEAVKANAYMVNPIVTIIFSVCLIILSIITIRYSKLPISSFGITLINSIKSIKESLIVTTIISVLLIAGKYWAINYTSLFPERVLFNTDAINWTFFSYLIVAPAQEFIARGVMQGSLQRMLTEKFHPVWSIILTALLFGVTHTFYSVPLAVIAVVTSLLWGWLYTRHRNIVGISISHFILGNLLMWLDFWKYLAA